MEMGLETLQGKIDEIKKDESYLRIQHALLELFAKRSSRKEYLDEIAELLCRWTGCRCGGIRVLDEYGNIPYASYLGFSREFWGPRIIFPSIKINAPVFESCPRSLNPKIPGY